MGVGGLARRMLFCSCLGEAATDVADHFVWGREGSQIGEPGLSATTRSGASGQPGALNLESRARTDEVRIGNFSSSPEKLPLQSETGSHLWA